jgi:hypothetical protein
MTTKRINTCWFFETEPTLAHPVPLTRYIFGFGWTWRWDCAVTDSGSSVYMFGPFTFVRV